MIDYLVRRVRRLNSKLGFVTKPIIRLVYRFYEQWLYEQVAEGPMPKHVAIIPDGNRRWAKSLGLNPNIGHEVGYERLEEVLKWLWDLGVKVVTVYAMSYENCLKRSEDEKNFLFNIMKRSINKFVSERTHEKYGVRVKFAGRLDLIPEDLRSSISEVEDLSSSCTNRFLNIALCYGGRQEILDAVRALAKEIASGQLKPSEVNEDSFRRYLTITSGLPSDDLAEPDLVIRTSGELRISNFLLWYIAYSELYFCDAYWPEFRRIDLLRAIRSYQRRERRFGL